VSGRSCLLLYLRESGSDVRHRCDGLEGRFYPCCPVRQGAQYLHRNRLLSEGWTARLGSRRRLRSRRPASGRFRLPGGNLCPYRRSGRRNGQGTLPVLPSVWTDRGMLRRILWTAVSVVPTSHPCI